MANLKTSASLSSVSKRYYVLSAKTLGMIDTPKGIRMERQTFSSIGNLTLKEKQEKFNNESSSSSVEEPCEKEEHSRKRRASPSTVDDKHKKQNTS